MKWIGQHIWDLTSRFRNDVYLEGLAETAETRGLVVDANGKVSINPLSGDEYATHIYENVRNDEGSTIPVGTPVYSKGEIGGSERIKVGIADASDPTKMPAIGITNTELTTTGDTKDGLITIVGVYNTNISGFTGLSENDIVYVAIGGGLTITKPTGVNLIQNIGIILKTNGNTIQGLQVACIGRTNDVPTPLYIDHANQRLGIGTTSPASPLHIYEDTSSAGTEVGLTIENDGTGDAIAQFLLTGSKRWVMGIDNSDSNKFKIADSSDLNTDALFTIDGDGNVGIGTTSPASELDVNGTITLSGDTEHQILKSTSSSYGLGGGETTFVYGRNVMLSAYDDVVLRAGSSDEIRMFAGDDSAARMTIDQNGNVGIGTTSPAYKLSVNGDVQSDFFRGYQYPTGSYLDFDDDTTPGSNGTALVSISSMKFTVDSNNNSTTDAFSWIVDGLPGSGTTLMTLLDEGNLGIGTTSPTANLEIGSDGAGEKTLKIHSDTASSYFQIESLGNIARLKATNNSNFMLRSDGGGGYITNWTNGAERMRITSAGNVGIGTTSPGATLDVKGITADNSAKAISAQNSSGTELFYVRNDGVVSVSNGYLYAQHSSGAYFEGSIKARGGITDDGGTLGLGASGDTSQLNIIGGGNVGIGTTSPNALLDVDNRIYLQNDGTVKWGASANAGHLTWDTNQAIVKGLSGQALLLGSNNTSARMTIDTSGNVGIGTTSPSAKLEVTDGSVILRPNTAGAALTWRESDNGNIAGQLRSYINRGDIYLYLEGTKTTEITAGNDSFIPRLHIGGTNQASAALQVTGNAVITGDLTVQGTTVTLDTANLNVEDKNITLNYSTGDSSGSADGAGITIQDAVDASNDATMLWNASSDRFDFSHPITAKDNIRFVTSGGTDGGLIDMDSNNDLVISNPLGGIFLGNGTDDVYIGDGTSSVDIRFEQNMSIYADSSTTRTLTLGGANTNLVLDSPNFSGTVTLGATSINNKLTFTTSNGYILFDYEPVGDTGEYTTEVPLLKVDHNGTEKTILSRISENGGIQLGHDDSVLITAGDVGDEIKANWGATNENVVLASEAGFYALAFPNNSTTWSNRNIFRFYGGSATAAENGLYIGDGSSTQFIDLDRNLKNIGTITATGDFNLTNGFYLAHNDGIRIGETGDASTSWTTLTSFTNGGNSAMKIKGGNYHHNVFFETTWNDFEYAKLNASYNGSDSNFYLYKSDSSGNTAATTTISTGTSSFAGTITANSNVDVHGTLRAHGGSLIIEDTDSDDIHGQINSNSTEGVLRLRNGANWGLIARGIGNTPRLGAYHGGDLRIYGFGAADGADHANDVEFAIFDFANTRLSVDGDVRADTHFTSSDTNVTLSTSSNGTVFLRPNGKNSTTAQSTFTNALASVGTSATFAGDVTLSGTAPTLRIQDSRNLNNPDWDSVSLGNIEFYTSDTTSPGARVLAEIEAFSNNAAASGPNADLIFKTSAIADSSPQTRLTIGYDGTSTFAGNVTAGSNSLTAGSLDINGNADISGNLTGVDILTATTLRGNHPDGNGLSLRLGRDDNSNYWEFNHAGNDLRIYNTASSGSDILLGVDASGTAQANNVGIGTATPSVKLDVVGDAQLQGTAPRFVMKETGTNKDFSLRVQTDGRLSILNDNLGSEVLVIKQDGNVGIGTTSPGQALHLPDNKRIAIGTGQDSQWYHDGSNTYLKNATGDLYIQNSADDKDIIFQCDDGSGGVTTYLTLDGGYSTPYVALEDSTILALGTHKDFLFTHDGTDSKIDNMSTGDIKIRNFADDSDIIFQSDNGSGGVETYFFLDGSEGVVNFPDNKRLTFGTDRDLFLYHDGTNAVFKNYVGDIVIQNEANDKDIRFKSDDGSGGVAEYFRVDGSSQVTIFSKTTSHGDNVKALFGASSDLQIYHDGSNSYINDTGTGSLYTLTNAYRLTNAAGSENMIWAEENSFVKLYYNNSAKLETTSTGVDVTGNVQADSYKISGATILSGNANVSLGSSGATGTISLNTHTSTALYVAGDDNVGIGNTSPSEKLEVTGNIAVSGTVDGVDIAARDAVLTSTTTTANAALPKAGGTMTGQLVVNHNAGTLNLVGTDHTYIQWYPAGLGGGRHAYTGFAGGGTDHFTIANETSGAHINLTTNSGTVNVTGNLSVSGTVDGVDIGANYANWNTAYGWGDHSSAGYLTSLPSHNHDDRYYTESESDVRFAALSHNHAASSIVTGTLADGRISESSVTQHEAALTITESQLPDDMPSDKVKQICTSHHNFFMNSTSTTTDFFVPFNNLNESSNPTNAQYYNRMVAPYNGRIVKVVLHTTAAIGTSCQVLFWVATSAGVFAPSAAETVTGVNLNTANTSATATFSTSSTAEFSEGDVLGVSIIKSTTATANMQVTVVWEYTL